METKKIAKICLWVIAAICFLIAVYSFYSLIRGYSGGKVKVVIESVSLIFISFLIIYLILIALYRTENLIWINLLKNFFEKKRRKKMRKVTRDSVLESTRFKLLDSEIINKIIGVIDNQVEKSRDEGLFIEEKDIVVEIFIFLTIIEQWKKNRMSRMNFDAQEAGKALDDRIEVIFKPFKLKNNIKDEAEQERSQQKYIAHLEEVKKEIINLIFGKEAGFKELKEPQACPNPNCGEIVQNYLSCSYCNGVFCGICLKNNEGDSNTIKCPYCEKILRLLERLPTSSFPSKKQKQSLPILPCSGGFLAKA